MQTDLLVTPEVIEKDNIVGIRKDTPIELNLIQSAMFSKNKNAVKTKEVNLDNLDILIRAVKGHTIPNSFDEDVFFAILHLFVKFKTIWRLDYVPRTIYITYSDLCSVLHLGTSYIDRVRTSLDKLASTSYKFINTFLYRDISCDVFNADELDDVDFKSVNLDNTILIHNYKVYNDNFVLNKSKIRTIIYFDSENKLNKALTTLKLSNDSINSELSNLLHNKPISILLPSNDKIKEYFLDVFSEHLITSSQVLVDEEEFLSDIRDELNGNKITDFKVRRNSITSTFNLINFIEYKTEELSISEMLKGAKLTKDTLGSVKAFLENKITGKTKYMLRIDINNYMYENIVNKVYLLHSLDYLLDFKDKTARAIYLFIESAKGSVRKKNKGIIKLTNPNIIIVDASILALSIPISMTDKQISSTINIFLRALEYLKNNGYIKNYITHREKPLRNTYFNIEFYAEQSRKHPEFSPYSIKVLPRLDNISEEDSAEDCKIPSEIKSVLESINDITSENIDALVVLYNENVEKKATYKNKNLNSNLGYLLVKAIANKINGNSTKIKSLSGYLYHAINHPEVYVESLELLKRSEYDTLYGSKAKAAEEAKIKAAKKKESEENFLKQQKEIEYSWNLLTEEEKQEYIGAVDKLKARKKIPEVSLRNLPIQLYAEAVFNKSYDPMLRFYTEC